MLSSNLEKTLRDAYQLATNNKHEFVTLEHLLYSLIDDKDALSVLNACGIDIKLLKKNLDEFIVTELVNLKVNFTGEPKLTNSFQRVLQRAAIHVQSNGREEVTGANMLVALFSEKESHAVYFLGQQKMSRLDAVQYISHGIAKVKNNENHEFINEETTNEGSTNYKNKKALDEFNIFVIDEIDYKYESLIRELGMQVLILPTIMFSLKDKIILAKNILSSANQ